MASLRDPLPTLRLAPHGTRRTAWGRCDSLGLHRRGLAPPAPCRSPGALPAAESSDSPPVMAGEGRPSTTSFRATGEVVDAGLHPPRRGWVAYVKTFGRWDDTAPMTDLEAFLTSRLLSPIDTLAASACRLICAGWRQPG